jgi:ferric-dicitrate binding protein FerR (iron transport regulator)
MDKDLAADADIEDLLTSAGSRPEPSAVVTDKAYQLLKDDWSDLVEARKRRRQRSWLSIAASVGVFVAATWMINVYQQPSSWALSVASGQVQLNSTTYRSAQSMTVHEGDTLISVAVSRFTQPDGADLRLADATEVRWQGSNRFYLVKGSAYIDTQGTTDFVVQTPLGDVRDIGTRFMVSVDDDELVVAVREGAAEVSSAFGAQVAQADDLRAKLVTVDANGQHLQEEAFSAPRWNWIHTVATGYGNHSLSVLITQIGHDIGKPIRFASRGVEVSVANDKVDGSLDNMPPRQALDIVARSAGLVWQENAQEIILDFKL